MQRTLMASAIILATLALGAALVVIGSASPTSAVTESEHEARTIKGTITSVDTHGNTFVMEDEERDNEEVTLRVDADTQYMLNGEEATREETLVEGYRAQVEHHDRLAHQVDATSPTS